MGADIQHTIEMFIGSESCFAEPPDQDDGRPTITVGHRARLTRVVHQLESKGFTRIRSFGLVPSADRARWIVPIDCKSWAIAGLRIMQPFSIRAKLLKPLLVAATGMGWTQWARDHAVIASRNPLAIESLVTEITGERRPVFALSLGTRGNFQKLSIRIMRSNGDLLGYIKLPLTPAAAARVRREAAVLQRLYQCPLIRPHVPRVLYAGEWGSTFVLFQSAKEAKATPVRVGELHRTFLERLSAVESVPICGRELVNRVSRNWNETESTLSARWRLAGRQGLCIARRELENVKLRCGISHGDFAPWNTLVSARQLFVFDWESAESHLPHSWDTFHFEVQVSLFLRRLRRISVTLDRQSGERASFLLYLLNSALGYMQDSSSAAAAALTYRYKLLNNQICAS